MAPNCVTNLSALVGVKHSFEFFYNFKAASRRNKCAKGIINMEGYDSDIFKAKRGKFFSLILLLIKNMFDILKNVVAII